MSLSYLSQYLLNTLVSSPPETWTQFQIPRDLTPKIILDPSVLGNQNVKELFIIPQAFYHQLEESNRRGYTISSMVTSYVIAVGLFVPLRTVRDDFPFHEDDSTNDSAASLTEEFACLNLWEEFTDYIMKNCPEKYTLMDVEPESPVEIELGFRNFLVLTNFTFKKTKC